MRIVLDTNTLVSALLFSGKTARLVPLWQSGRMAVLIFREILEEYIKTLSYPKFKLSDAEMTSFWNVPWPERRSIWRRGTRTS